MNTLNRYPCLRTCVTYVSGLYTGAGEGWGEGGEVLNRAYLLMLNNSTMTSN